MKLADSEAKFEPSEDQKCAIAENGMVSTAFPDATQAGIEILRQGGNAVDAACASALALSVCEPQASGLGGQTMMLVSLGKKTIAIDGSSRAPSLAHVNAIYKMDREYGYRATTVPSTLATLGYTHRHYGKLPWQQIVEPAIEIAQQGYTITHLQYRLQVRELENFEKIESKSGKKYFFNDGYPYTAGELFKQPELAHTLSIIAKEGVEPFYTGEIAKIIDADMREHGGLLRYDDLALIPWPIERKPLSRRFRNVKVLTMPPPGAGRTLLFVLMMMNTIPPQRLHKDQIKRAHLLAEIFRKAFLERSDRPFDPNFYPQISDEKMINAKYAHESIKQISKSVDQSLPIRESLDESVGETTHLSVMDQYGGAVSLTQSIERVYGSKAAAQGLGFLYNNYLMDYEYSVPSHPFYLRPNAVPWASVAPSLFFYNENVWMAAGSPGSERSVSSISQFLTHITDRGLPMSQAIIEPRLHCSLGGRISLEAERFDPRIIHFFENKGYRVDKRESFSFYLGAIHAVIKKTDNSGFQGVAEVRRDGVAGGYS